MPRAPGLGPRRAAQQELVVVHCRTAAVIRKGAQQELERRLAGMFHHTRLSGL
jgi:hypothetical protein